MKVLRASARSTLVAALAVIAIAAIPPTLSATSLHKSNTATVEPIGSPSAGPTAEATQALSISYMSARVDYTSMETLTRGPMSMKAAIASADESTDAFKKEHITADAVNFKLDDISYAYGGSTRSAKLDHATMNMASARSSPAEVSVSLNGLIATTWEPARAYLRR